MSEPLIHSIASDRPYDLIIKQRDVQDGHHRDIMVRPVAGGTMQFDGTKNPVVRDIPVIGGHPQINPTATAANITTAGNETLTAANLLVGLITRDPAGAARTDTTDTAAHLIETLAMTANYQERFCTLVNTADAAETITLAGGTGVTLKGTITAEQGTAIRLAIMRTGASAVCVRQV